MAKKNDIAGLLIVGVGASILGFLILWFTWLMPFLKGDDFGLVSLISGLIVGGFIFLAGIILIIAALYEFFDGMAYLTGIALVIFFVIFIALKKSEYERNIQRKISWFSESVNNTQSIHWEKKGEMLGAFDKFGEIVIPAIYEEVYNDAFRNGIAIVKRNGKWGIIDQSNHIMVDFIYDRIVPTRYATCISAEKKGETSIIDYKGTILKHASKTFHFVDSFGEGPFRVYQNGYFFVNRFGKKLSEEVYPSAESFSEGLASVQVRNRNWGYIDTSGRIAIEPIYMEAREFLNGYAKVRSISNYKYGLINSSGREVIPFLYDKISYPDEDGILSAETETSCKLMDVHHHTYFSLNSKFKPEEWENGKFIRNNCIKIKSKGSYNRFTYGMVDISGSLLISPTHDSIVLIRYESGAYSYNKFLINDKSSFLPVIATVNGTDVSYGPN
ncbi:MAG: WG repeat-containing protein [Marinilabiliales bacterium]|nr:WG repeat-containing protein [Marinilabiliales bacterium]